jgi:hypothetical protein
MGQGVRIDREILVEDRRRAAQDLAGAEIQQITM